MMTNNSFTLSRAALRGRSMGVFACTGFGALWACSALALGPTALHNAGYLVVALMTGSLLWAMLDMLRHSRQMTAASDPAPLARRRMTGRFLGIFAAEIVLINIAAHVLNSQHALQYLMPAIAIVVGLHFYLLAPLFRVPIYHVTATMMTLAGVAGVIALALQAPAGSVNAFVDALCAITLWATGFVSWRSTTQPADENRPLPLS